MKRQIQSWGTRTLAVAAVVLAANHWGAPLYKQYFVPKKTSVFVPTAKVREGRFVVSFNEIGTLQAESSVSIFSEIEAKIVSLIAEGTTVQPGQVLVRLDTSALERDIESKVVTVEQRKSDVARAKSTFDMLVKQNKTEIEQAQVQLEFDKAEAARVAQELEKKKRLADEKLVPRDQVSQAELELRTKELAVRKGEMSLALLREKTRLDEQQKEADVRSAEGMLQLANLDLSRLQSMRGSATILAPASGMVVISKSYFGGGEHRKFKEGDQVWKGRTICQLPDLSSMQVKVQVGESDAPKVHVDMPVLIKLEAVPKKRFQGKVKEISKLATEADIWESGGGAAPGRKNFEVTIAVKEVDPKTIKPGMTADVEFVRDVVAKAVYVPIEAVVERGNETSLFVKRGKRYDRVKVKLGERNDSFVTVVKGVRRGDVIALRDPARPSDEQQSASSPSGARPDNKPEKAVATPKADKK